MARGSLRYGYVDARAGTASLPQLFSAGAFGGGLVWAARGSAAVKRGRGPPRREGAAGLALASRSDVRARARFPEVSLYLVTFVALALFGSRADAQQSLGHKTLGTLGLDAGSQPPTGVYVADRFVWYTAGALVDRNGRTLPVDLDLDAIANAAGVYGTYEIPRLHLFVGASFGAPVAHVWAHTDRPEASIDRFGLADLYVQPLKLGFRKPHFDVVAGYAFYVPTGSFSPGQRGGVSRAQWSHELSLGGTAYFDRARTWRLSALGSYELNQKKLGIDITRGDTIQVQGGAGKTLAGVVDVGAVGYAQWQVRDDRGADLPPVLRGARDRVYGLGAEAAVRVDAIRTRFNVRWAHDFAVESRPRGQIFLVGATFVAHLRRPAAPPSPPQPRVTTGASSRRQW